MTAKKYLKMMGMDDDELKKFIQKMPEEEAKDTLFKLISFSNNARRAEIEKTFGAQNP